ncbi:carbonic anhydrase [Microbacterium faecale]|uniref:Carbonic anhydrase n=1 Tax=Microbacterium faecale TaxID=1804630 RepID=A0A917DJ62_9MICO|nr:carbonic anhydrase [Microbacterium faecale]GGD42009.1 carbonic anhydrase [Microbacterium faecale]HJB63517.1 carbonic anhydrase [Candidatus Microbacterium pullistercoris]
MMVTTPAQAWQRMQEGNERFVAGTPNHPHQDVDRRHEVAIAQRPTAALFGCSDSRLAAEIIFDMGLGDLFVIRNAGQVTGESIMGTIEYAVDILEVPLIVVLGHDECGAVRAAIDSLEFDAPALAPAIWRQVSPIVPSARRVRQEQIANGDDDAPIDPTRVGQLHLRDTITAILHSSELISDAVASGRLGIVGANYRLAEGAAVPDVTLGVADDSAAA